MSQIFISFPPIMVWIEISVNIQKHCTHIIVFITNMNIFTFFIMIINMIIIVNVVIITTDYWKGTINTEM